VLLYVYRLSCKVRQPEYLAACVSCVSCSGTSWLFAGDPDPEVSFSSPVSFRFTRCFFPASRSNHSTKRPDSDAISSLGLSTVRYRGLQATVNRFVPLYTVQSLGYILAVWFATRYVYEQVDIRHGRLVDYTD